MLKQTKFIFVKNFPLEVEHSTLRYTKADSSIFRSRIFNIASEVNKNCCRFHVLVCYLCMVLYWSI